jgi:biofilm PGA synthesis N-glycosyltransferase PgaC
VVKFAFWISAGVLAYAYAGYPLWLALCSVWRKRPVKKAPIEPSVSIVVAVHNEAAVLPAKLQNLWSLDYPAEKYEIVVASDGSEDRTSELLANGASDRMRAVICPEHFGKAAALNAALALASGEIIIFTDARQMLEADAVRHLVSNFADAQVGAVSGELMLGDPRSASPRSGLGLYWQIEKQVRRLEGVTGSMVGVTGAVYAARRHLIDPLPVGTILDDVLVPMRIARKGYRVTWEPGAKVWDEPPSAQGHEFRRKVRTLVGNYQLLNLAPWLVTPRNPLLFRFVSHKLLRLIGPAFLAGLLASSLLLSEAIYRIAATLQLLFYALAVIAAAGPGFRPLRRAADSALAFLLLNTAAVVAFAYVVARRKEVRWR